MRFITVLSGKKCGEKMFKAGYKLVRYQTRLSANMSLHDLTEQCEKLLEDNTDFAEFPFSLALLQFRLPCLFFPSQPLHPLNNKLL